MEAAVTLERAHPGSGQLHGPVLSPETKAPGLVKDGSIIKVSPYTLRFFGTLACTLLVLWQYFQIS